MRSTRQSTAKSWELYTALAGVLLICAADFLDQMKWVQVIMTVGPIKLGPSDFLCFALIAVGMFNFARRRQLSWLDIIFLVLVLLALIQFLRGFINFGTYAGVEARQDANVLASIFYLSHATKYSTRRELAVMYAIYGGAILLTWGFHEVGFGTTEWLVNVGDASYLERRFIDGDGTLGMFCLALVCFSLAFHNMMPKTAWKFGVVGVVTFFMSLIPMYRSVWVAEFIAGLVFVFLQFSYGLISKRIAPLLLISLLLFLFMLTLLALNNESVNEAFSEVAQYDSTIAWRLEGWQGILDKMDFVDFIVGRGYGSDISRWVGDQLITNSAHNFYIDKLWKFGIGGLMLYLVLYAKILIALFKIADRTDVIEERALATLLISLITSNLIYFMAYADWIPVIITFSFAFSFARTTKMHRGWNPAMRLEQPAPIIGAQNAPYAAQSRLR